MVIRQGTRLKVIPKHPINNQIEPHELRTILAAQVAGVQRVRGRLQRREQPRGLGCRVRLCRLHLIDDHLRQLRPAFLCAAV